MERSVSSKSPPNESASASGSEKDTLTAKAEAKKLKMPFVDPLCVRIEPAAVALLEPDMAISRQALPIRLVNDTLLVAMAFPGDTVAVRSLELLTGLKISPAAAPKSSVSTALKKVYGKGTVPNAKNRQSTAMFAPAGAFQKRTKGAFSISIISNKGGVGKTHLSINLA